MIVIVIRYHHVSLYITYQDEATTFIQLYKKLSLLEDFPGWRNIIPKALNPPKKTDSQPVLGKMSFKKCLVAITLYCYHVRPGRLTWNLRIHPGKRKVIFQIIIFGVLCLSSRVYSVDLYSFLFIIVST